MSVNNLSKLFQYIGPLCIKPPIVDGMVMGTPATKIQLATSFFMADTCDSCGHCCPAEQALLTESEYKRLMDYDEQAWADYGLNIDYLRKTRTLMEPELHTINGCSVKLYRHPERSQEIAVRNREPRSMCAHLFQYDDTHFRCSIHPIRSLTCRMPHTRIFYSVRGTVSFGISQFGRNHLLGCKIQFKEPVTAEEFNTVKANRLDMLNYMLQIATDLKCETHVPTVIAYVDRCTFENYKARVGVDFMPRASMFAMLLPS